MSVDILESQVQARRPESLATAAQLGPAAGPVLARLARDKNPEVRAQSLICLRASGGPDAAPTALAALNDDDGTVVAQAIQVLHAHPPADDRALLAAYQHAQEARDQLALIAGRLGAKATVAAWKNHLRGASLDTSLGRSLLAAVSRMGDAEARKEFAVRLETVPGRDAQTWLDLAVYQEDRWVLTPLSKLLDRKERAMELTPDDPSDLRPLRTCDLAANAILRLTGAKPSFSAPRATPYTDVELTEFRRLAADPGTKR